MHDIDVINLSDSVMPCQTYRTKSASSMLFVKLFMLILRCTRNLMLASLMSLTCQVEERNIQRSYLRLSLEIFLQDSLLEH